MYTVHIYTYITCTQQATLKVDIDRYTNNSMVDIGPLAGFSIPCFCIYTCMHTHQQQQYASYTCADGAEANVV